MNVSFVEKDPTWGLIRLEIVKNDYAAAVEAKLRTARRRANVPGFRVGMVPMGMIKKMYGKSILLEEINRLVSENLFKYVKDNNLPIIGEPMPSESEPSSVDLEEQDDFVFNYDVILYPKFEVSLSKEDTLTYYQVNIDDDMLNKQIEAYAANFGSYEKVDDAEEKDLVKGTIAELENGAPKEGGIVVENAVLMPQYIKDEEEKAKFIGAKTNSVIVFNPHKAFNGSEPEIASFLRVKKEQVAELTGDFSFEIKEITRHKNAEMNQALFDKVFGDNVVTSEEEFKNMIREALVEQFTPQSDYKFLNDARPLLMEKAGDIKLADNLLIRWLKLTNEKATPEALEKDYYDSNRGALIYDIIRNSLVSQAHINVSDEDIDDYAKRIAKAQFAQYGMLSVPEDVLDNYAKGMLKNMQTLENIRERAKDEKLAAWMKEQVTLDLKLLSPEEFAKLFA